MKGEVLCCSHVELCSCSCYNCALGFPGSESQQLLAEAWFSLCKGISVEIIASARLQGRLLECFSFLKGFYLSLYRFNLSKRNDCFVNIYFFKKLLLTFIPDSFW